MAYSLKLMCQGLNSVLVCVLSVSAIQKSKKKKDKSSLGD